MLTSVLIRQMSNALTTQALLTTAETWRSQLSHLRHELRTPLNALVGYSEMLCEEAAELAAPDLQRGFHQLNKQARRLLTLVNGLLEATRLDTGKLSLGLDNVLPKLRQQITPPAEELLALCGQLLERCTAVEAEALREDLEKVRAAGTALLKALVTPGHAPTRFLRMLAKPAAPPAADPANKVAPAKVLVVDGNEANCDILARQLYREGHMLFVASDSASAWRLLAQQSFELILLDVMMPELNGYELLARLKQAPEWRDLPVIVLSTLDDTASIVRCLELGAEDYLAKPFDPVILRKRIGATLERQRLREQLRGQLKTIQQELDVAARIQQSILPSQFPVSPYFELCAEMQPAREVGGDFYDFFMLDERRLGVVIGDVSGKGVPAALFMAVTRTLVKSVALTGKTAGECLQQVNRLLAEENSSFMFVSLFYGILNLADGRFEYANAGHNAPYYLDALGTVTPLPVASSIVLGINEDFAYQTEFVQLWPGDRLLLYTDGVTEAFNQGNDMFGEARLQRCLLHAGTARPSAMLPLIVEAVRQFAAGAPPSDDLTLLALRYL